MNPAGKHGLPCPYCGFDLRGVASPECPECGHTANLAQAWASAPKTMCRSCGFAYPRVFGAKCPACGLKRGEREGARCSELAADHLHELRQRLRAHEGANICRVCFTSFEAPGSAEGDACPACASRFARQPSERLGGLPEAPPLRHARGFAGSAGESPEEADICEGGAAGHTPGEPARVRPAGKSLHDIVERLRGEGGRRLCAVCREPLVCAEGEPCPVCGSRYRTAG